jgi:hypothetical protein
MHRQLLQSSRGLLHRLQQLSAFSSSASESLSGWFLREDWLLFNAGMLNSKP